MTQKPTAKSFGNTYLSGNTNSRLRRVDLKIEEKVSENVSG